MRPAARLLFAAIVRALAAAGGAITAYGATAMFTSNGVEPPNAIVYAGLAVSAAVAVVLLVRDRSLRGTWPALLVLGVPYALYAFGSWGVAECPQPHPLIGSGYTCAPVGSHAIAIAAPVLAAIGATMFVRDIRALASR